MNHYRSISDVFFRNLTAHLIIVSLAVVCLSGCSVSPVKQQSSLVSSQQYFGKENAVSKLTEDKIYKVSLYSQKYPFQTGKIFHLNLRLTTPDGIPLENKKIRVHGGMPQHQHGFPTAPRVTKYLGDGNYLVEGVKFSMPGIWEIRFNIKEKVKRDRVVFKIKI